MSGGNREPSVTQLLLFGQPMTSLIKYYGKHCCQALAQQRYPEIARVFLTKARLGDFAFLTKQLARERKAYHLVTEDELAKIANSVHHEGIVLEAPRPNHASLESVAKGSRPLLWLDGVQNPHNLGAIMRSAANFNFAALLGQAKDLPEISPSAARIAEGGIESVALCRYQDTTQAVALLKREGWQFIVTSSHKGRDLFQVALPQKSILVMGNEVKGVSKDVFALAHHVVQIPGTGKVESLNVSVATAIFMAEYARQHGLGTAKSK